MGFDQDNQARKGAPRGCPIVPPTGVPVATARTVSRWIAAHRKAHDVRPWQRAATSWVQAVMLLRWLIDATDVAAVARDAGVSPATGYRYQPRGPGRRILKGAGPARRATHPEGQRGAVRVPGAGP